MISAFSLAIFSVWFSFFLVGSHPRGGGGAISNHRHYTKAFADLGRRNAAGARFWTTFNAEQGVSRRREAARLLSCNGRQRKTTILKKQENASSNDDTIDGQPNQPGALKSTSKRIAMHLNGRGESKIRKGYPWVFRDDIAKQIRDPNFATNFLEQNRDGSPGDVVVIFDRNDKFLALHCLDYIAVLHSDGVFLNSSACSVKGQELSILSLEKAPVNGQWLADRAVEAAMKRIKYFKDPSVTNAYRVINGENDGMGGLVCDRYNSTIVFKLYTGAWLPYLDGIVDELMRAMPETDHAVLLFSRSVQNLDEDTRMGMKHSQTLRGRFAIEGSENGSLSSKIRFVENSIRFQCDPYKGQKTGFFLDQRENRERLQPELRAQNELINHSLPNIDTMIKRLCHGKSVLNVFAYTGAFSLYAARGGADEVVSVDICKKALDEAANNFELNPPLQQVHEMVCGDAFEEMKQMIRENRKFDVVIVDPPSMASSKQHVNKATRAYERLASMALKLLKQEGWLVFASCSNKINPALFFKTIEQSALKEKRPLRIVERTGHAIDHPVSFDDGQYLKCLFAQART
eukprot:jgi/Bigna1/74010/fgenesh1_pg.27_\